MDTESAVPPAGAVEVGDWTEFDDRFFRLPTTTVEDVAVTVTGVQTADGFTDSGINVGIGGQVVVASKTITIGVDLTVEQARRLGRVLLEQADQCQALDGTVPVITG